MLPKVVAVCGIIPMACALPVRGDILSAERSRPMTMDSESIYAEQTGSSSPWALTLSAEGMLNSAKSATEVYEAVRLLKLAASQNEPAALYRLGALSMIGKGVPRSPIEGFEYCRQAAELGYAPAQYQLAALYALGEGTAPDEEKAIYWGRKAIAQGNAKAKYSIGRLLLLRAKPEEREEAVDLLTQASSEGIVEAAVLLAEAYAEGSHGLTPDAARARGILQGHADAGDPQAKEALEKIQPLPPAGQGQ